MNTYFWQFDATTPTQTPEAPGGYGYISKCYQLRKMQSYAVHCVVPRINDLPGIRVSNLMAFLRMNEIERLPAPERIYLANLEQALGGFVSRIPSTLPDDVVDEELIARATVTIFLAIAARCAIDAGIKQNISVTQREFDLLAREALHAARKATTTFN